MPAAIRNVEEKLKIRVRRFPIAIIVAAWLITSAGVRAQSPCAGLEDCLKDLKSQDASRKSGAIFILGTLKDRRATSALVDLLKQDRDPGIRLSVIKAVGFLREPSAVPVLAELLDDQELQSDAVRALVQIANKPAVEALIQGLKHPEIQVAAARGLGEIADPSSKPALIALFRRTEDGRVRGVSAMAVQRINSIWGPSEEEMGLPLYPKSEFIPNARGEWVFVSKDPLPKVSDFFKKHLKTTPLSFQDFKKKYENGFAEAKEGTPLNQPNLIFVAQEQRFEGRTYPAKLIFLQTNQKETEIKIFNAVGAPD
ncbi:MAG: HEAT repeat domain-containing protein [Nitrospirae bacterium]|nr:HEAT repeat domain-containing protein [Nitrospirota bacterium]